MVNYVCGFSQSELGKYFEWILIKDNRWMQQKYVVYQVMTSDRSRLSDHVIAYGDGSQNSKLYFQARYHH